MSERLGESNLNRRAEFTKMASAVIWDIVKSNPPRLRVPYAGLVFDRTEVEEALGALFDAFTSGWFAIGKFGALFEERFARILGASGAVLTNSGSSANLIAVATLVHLKRLNPGDEVLTPATTFPTTINPLLLYGLKPVLIDVDLPSYAFLPNTLIRSSSSKTKAVLLPHLNGIASNMREISELCSAKGWVLIEDCCDALGTTVDGRQVGSFGDISAFSFYAAHHLGMGEGGAVVSTDQQALDVVRSIRDWGRLSGREVPDMSRGRIAKPVGPGFTLPEDYEARFTYITKGFNLKPLDIQAAIGLAQLDKLQSFIQARKRNFQRLAGTLSKHSDFLILPQPLQGVDPSWFVLPLLVNEKAKFKRHHLVKHLEEHGIETRPILAGNILKQPAYSNDDFLVRDSLSNSDLILRNGFFVGVYPGLTEDQLSRIEDGFESFFKGAR